MKETYVKPVICFESFALSQTIARQCSGSDAAANSNHYSENTGCSYDIGGETVFYEASNCDFDMELADEVGMTMEQMLEELGMCYNNPEGGYQVFSST